MSWKIELDSDECFHIQQSITDNTLLICGHPENYAHDCIEKLCPLKPANSPEQPIEADAEKRCLDEETCDKTQYNFCDELCRGFRTA